MKLWIVFILLKIVEISAVVFVPYLVGFLPAKWIVWDENCFKIWLMGCIVISMFFLLVELFGPAFLEIIKLNLELARAIVG
jgi:hypothetical protein